MTKMHKRRQLIHFNTTIRDHVIIIWKNKTKAPHPLCADEEEPY